MDSIEAKLKSREIDVEIMEQIALSDTSEPEFAGSKLQDDTEDKSKVYNKIAAKFGNVLVSLRGNLFVIKRVVQDFWFQYVRGENSDRIRAYHVWPGNNVYIYLYYIFTGNGLSNHSRLIVTISVILTVIVLVNLILVSANDPGIIPRNDQASVEAVGHQEVAIALFVTTVSRNLITTARGSRNYRFYLTFVISAFIFFMYIFAFSVLRIHQRIEKDNIGFIGLLKNCPETLALVSFSFAATCFLGGLAVFHVYLIAMNQTGYENFRQRYADSKNPYDKGIISNYKEVLFVPLPPSRVDFRAEVMPIWQIKSTRDVLR
ncbi:hypothetical protein EZV62_020624 [Acer yangbiense]|uniref:S-acyltransferase n=1 Tax=Acer yangbiense TaxID=1000413 RepID=A0A5C7HF61_9ROSI|nr:hypothetical protein EZV62_020624 [Acer yangbiense]